MPQAVWKESWKQKAKKLKSEVVALYFAWKDPRMPWYAKLFSLIIVGYALSPIDLIPDFIPVLGYIDDLILIPLGVALAIKIIPPVVMADARKKASEVQTKPKVWIGAVIIIGVWILIVTAVVLFIFKKL
ncbi:Protein of unknown function [Caldanaerobius fijiensis DSM 17918]|uniref:DUF1232 domain-containing protein n=1 Tax=Caldanaerobius fijiensis DSM 17918 TaxID=1121256 RepID=A0A1M5CFI2_9THEO|nr:YkvA family protein [Caldanaerobius fijiensis]SHF53488.1 Protein of unknown function [Caldanaerobius fijiensis DSM 17918]